LTGKLNLRSLLSAGYSGVLRFTFSEGAQHFVSEPL